MKRLLILLLLTPVSLLAQSAFTGTWHFSTQSAQFSGKPTMFSLKDGMYRCDTCVPKLNVKADGEYHPVTGSPYYDMISVKAVDDHTIESVSKKNGKETGGNKDTLSADGNSLTTEWRFVAENGQEGHGKNVATRVAPAPAGAHPASGSWQVQKVEDASESVLTITYKGSDDGLSMSDMTGDSYDAKFDGKDYPFKGDPGTTSVSLKKINANTVEETDKRNGKPIYVTHLTVSADGNTMNIETKDLLHGQTSKFEGKKQ